MNNNPPPRLYLACALLALLIGFPAAGQFPLGSEFRVNSYTTGTQHEPAVASDAAGNVVVVWDSFTPPGAAPAPPVIRGQLFAADGSPRGGELQAATHSTIALGSPQVSMSAEGNFVVVWESGPHNTYYGFRGRSIGGRRFDANGTPRGAEFEVNTDNSYSFQGRPDVASLPSGEFIVVWDNSLRDGIHPPAGNVLARRYAADGTAIGSDFRVNSDTAGGDIDAAVAFQPSGEFVVVWTSYRMYVPGDGAIRIRGRRFAADGTAAGGDFQVGSAGDFPDSGYSYRPDIAAGSDAFLVVWGNNDFTSGFDLLGRLYATAGDPLDDEFPIAVDVFFKPNAAITHTPKDEFVAIWRDDGVQARRITQQGELMGEQVQVSTGGRVPIGVAASPDGGFFAVWPDNVGSSDGDIFARRFSGTPCVPSDSALCLNKNRFRVEATWTDFQGSSGTAHAIPFTADTGTFWFFSPDNVELMIKVLDGRGINGHFWVFYGALSNVEYTITVTDTETDRIRTYLNSLGQFGSFGDTTAFPD